MVWFNTQYWLPYGCAIFVVILPYVFNISYVEELKYSESLYDEFVRLQVEHEELIKERKEIEEREVLYSDKEKELENKKFEFMKRFTDREKDIINMLINGFSYKEISTKFSISEKTVNSHAQNVYKKAEVRGRGELIFLFGKFTSFNVEPK